MSLSQSYSANDRETRSKEEPDNHEADVEDEEPSDEDKSTNFERTAGAEPEETAQNWLLRHLRLLLVDVVDTTLTDFMMQQDITAFRNFLTRGPRRRCLFVSIHRPQDGGSPRRYFENSPLQIIEDSAETRVEDTKAAEEQLAQDLKGESKRRTKTRRKMRPSRKARSTSPVYLDDQTKSKKKKKPNPSVKRQRARSVRTQKSKKRSDKSKEKKKPPAEPEVVPPVEQQVAVTLTDGGQLIVPFDVPKVAEPAVPEVDLQWKSSGEIPVDCEEFIFIAMRDEPNTGLHSEFDRAFVVGHCRFADKFRQIVEIAAMLLDEANEFERQIDLLLQLELPLTERRERWQNAEKRFENFIADSLVFAFQSTFKRNQLEALMESTVEVDVESIESLLRSRVRVFTKSPTPDAVIQVKLELSLYEIKFLSGESYTPHLIERLQRIATIFAVLHMLYAQSAGEWIHKTLFHCVELTARSLASNMHQRVWNLVYEDCEGERKPTEICDQEHATNMNRIKPILLELIDLGLRATPALSDEFLCLEKIFQCVRIVDFIEEEFSKLRSSVFNFRDPRRDMTFDRALLDAAREIVRNVWSTFEESYFESALESGNYDCMKNVCLQLSDLNIQMSETLPPLDSFCL